jgi:hypothetical protein
LLHDAWIAKPWFSMPISILPNLLGFSLGGLAIWLAFGDEKFRSLLLQKDEGEDHSSYVIASSSFVHFVIIQFLALIFAICSQVLNYVVTEDSITGLILKKFGLPINFFCSWYPYTGAFGFLIFLYALLSGVAATFQVFRLVTLFEKVSNHPAFKTKNESTSDDSNGNQSS